MILCYRCLPRKANNEAATGNRELLDSEIHTLPLSKFAATQSFYGILRVIRGMIGFDFGMHGRAYRTYLLSTLKWTARTAWGLALCSGLAFTAAYLFSRRPSRIFLPLLFVIVIVAVAARYGVMVGILGSVVSAAIFAHVLYPPLHSLAVSDSSARASLAWMILGGIAIPYLLLPGLRSRNSKK